MEVSGSNKIYKLEAKKSRRRETPTLSACADSSSLLIFAVFVTFLALFGTFCLKESCITCHKSHVTFHLSPVTFHLLLTPTATDLPLLVPGPKTLFIMDKYIFNAILELKYLKP